MLADPPMDQLGTVTLECKLDVHVLKLPYGGEWASRRHDAAFFDAFVKPLIVNQARVQYARLVTQVREQQ